MSGHGYDPATDEGMALERTSLAWNRTGLAFAATGAISLRFVDYGHLLTALLLALAAVSWAHGQARYRKGRVPADPRVVAAVSLGTAAVAAVAGATAVFA